MIHVFIGLLLVSDAYASFADEKQLYKDLLSDYNPSIRPATNPNISLKVQFQILIHKLRSYDLKTQVLAVTAFTMMQWVDPQLAWNMSKYGGVKQMNFLNNEIWTPDIVLYNSAYEERETWLSTYPTRPIARYDGRILWNMPVIWYVACQSDITWFPVDRQECTLQFGSWSYAKLQLELSPWVGNFSHSNQDNFHVPNGEWEIVKEEISYVEARFPCCPEPFSMMNHTVEFNHLSSFYFIYIILPMTALCFLFLLVFFIPIESGERLGFGVTVILSITVYLLVISDKLPQKSDVNPLLGIVFVGEFFVLCFGLMISAVSVVIHSNHKSGPVFLRKLARVSQRKVKQIEMLRHDNLTSENQGENANDESNRVRYVVNEDKKTRARRIKEEWEILARFLDRFGFVFTLFMLIFYPIIVAFALPTDGLG